MENNVQFLRFTIVVTRRAIKVTSPDYIAQKRDIFIDLRASASEVKLSFASRLMIVTQSKFENASRLLGEFLIRRTSVRKRGQTLRGLVYIYHLQTALHRNAGREPSSVARIQSSTEKDRSRTGEVRWSTKYEEKGKDKRRGPWWAKCARRRDTERKFSFHVTVFSLRSSNYNSRECVLALSVVQAPAEPTKHFLFAK